MRIIPRTRQHQGSLAERGYRARYGHLRGLADRGSRPTSSVHLAGKEASRTACIFDAETILNDALCTFNPKNGPQFGGRIDYRLWAKKACAGANLSIKNMFYVFEGLDEPEDTAAKLTWQRDNNDRFSILFLSTSGSAATVVEKDHLEQGKGLGSEQAACEALTNVHKACTKYTRRAATRSLVISRWGEDKTPTIEDL